MDQRSLSARALTIADIIDSLIRRIGEAVAWLALGMVLVTFLIVVLRYALDLGWIALQESVTYMHGVLFMLGIAYTLGKDGHVRVDIVYQRFSARTQAWIDLLGSLLLLTPVTLCILWLGWNYVSESWWNPNMGWVLEGSREAGGLPGVFLLKTLILLMPLLLLAQGLTKAMRNALYLNGYQDARPDLAGVQADD